MTRYLISFEVGAMTFPEEELPDVAKASWAVVEQAKAAGVWVFGGGLDTREVSTVATDGSVTEGTDPRSTDRLSGFSVVDVPTRDEALEWAARIAVSCRCAQEVREIMPDPDV